MSTRKRVFITGATSELILQVITKIDKEQFEVIGLTRRKNHPRLSYVEWVEGDIQNPDSYKHLLKDCQIIIHAAAVTHCRDENEYSKINHQGTKKLLNAIPTDCSPLFVLISSRVAGEKSGAYGVSKLRAEEEVRKLANWLIIRPSEIFGVSKNEGIEKTILTGIKGGLQLCPIGLESKMFPIHLSDSAEGIFRNVFDENQRNRVLYLNGENGYFFYELLRLIERVSGKRMFIIPIPKAVLQVVAFLTKILPVNVDFVPDQVDRLYSTKTHGNETVCTIKLEDYVKEKALTFND